MSQKLNVYYNPADRISSSIIDDDIAVVRVSPTFITGTFDELVNGGEFLTILSETIKNLPQQTPQIAKFRAIVEASGNALEYDISVRESILDGKNVFEAQVDGLIDVPTTFVAGSAGAAATEAFVAAAARGLGVVGKQAPLPPVVKIAVNVGGAILGVVAADASGAIDFLKDSVRSVLGFAGLDSDESSITDLNGKPFALVLDAPARMKDLPVNNSSNVELQPGTYTVIPGTQPDGTVYTVGQDDRVIFQGKKGNLYVDYSGLSINTPINVNLVKGTVSTGPDDTVRDYPGGAVSGVYGTKGRDTLTGAGTNDFLYGNGGNDLIAGGGGDDTLLGTSSTGGIQRDILTGGSGADVFVAGLNDIGNGSIPGITSTGNYYSSGKNEVGPGKFVPNRPGGERGDVDDPINAQDFVFITDYNPDEDIIWTGTQNITTEVMNADEVEKLIGSYDDSKIYTALITDADNDGFPSEGEQVIAIVQSDEPVI